MILRYKIRIPIAMQSKILLAAVALAVALPAGAGEQLLVLDTAASTATFTLDTTLHLVHGTLALRSGEIRFDTQSGIASGEVLIDATLTDTDNAKRDKKMHGKVLESARYPTIVFKPEKIVGTLGKTGRSELDLHGGVSIHGSGHPLMLHVAVEVTGERLSGKTSFAVPFVEWGMEDPSAFIFRVSKEVEVTIDLVGRLTAP
jgi:polyisoprenoid-binding protein YceI